MDFLTPVRATIPPPAQQEKINNWVRIGVAAAEQIYVGSGRGTEKKAHVLAFLKSKGVTFDVESVDAMIEAAVYELTNGFIKVGEAAGVVETE